MMNMPLNGSMISNRAISVHSKINLLKPFFIFFNLLAFISFWILFLQCKKFLDNTSYLDFSELTTDFYNMQKLN